MSKVSLPGYINPTCAVPPIESPRNWIVPPGLLKPIAVNCTLPALAVSEKVTLPPPYAPTAKSPALEDSRKKIFPPSAPMEALLPVEVPMKNIWPCAEPVPGKPKAESCPLLGQFYCSRMSYPKTRSLHRFRRSDY